MYKTFLVLSASFIAIATIGFLLIQYVLDNKIKNKENENIDLISHQEQTLRWIEKANSYREQAISTQVNVNIMKALNIENTNIKKSEEMVLTFLRNSLSSTINALLSSKEITNEQGESLINEINPQTETELKEKYLANTKQAADATYNFSKKIENNKKDINRLEKNKNCFWYSCFTIQSLGLIFGLLAILFKIAK